MTTLTAADSSLDPVVTVADRSVTLSTDLHHVAELCSHQETAIEISNVAGELALLSTTLHQLRKAMLTNDKYTAAFNQDLQEITTELTFLLDEIAECCSEMQKTDHNNSAAAWFFKKGRVGKLEKHLEALKTTLVVMRSVLHHGKEYGQEDTFTKSESHTMSQDRAILDSVFAKNRRAIVDLDTTSKKYQSSSSESQPNVNLESLSALPSLTDTAVNSPATPEISVSGTLQDAANPVSLARRFSKRARLDVLESMRNLDDAPGDLRRKWLNPSSKSQTAVAMTSIPEEHSISDISVTRQSSDSTVRSSEVSTRQKRSIMDSPAGKTIGGLIHRLSVSRGAGAHKVEATDKGKENDPDEKAETGPLKYLSMHFKKPPLKTPDYDEHYRYGSL